MIFNKNIALFLISIFVLSACDTAEDEPVPTSSDVSFTTVTMLGANVNDATALDAGPEVSYDGLELYFHSDRTGGEGGLDLYVSKRASTSDSWGAAENMGASINSSGNDKDASISKDGLTLVIASDRAGTTGGYDLYLSTRASLSDPWSIPANLGNVVNTSLNESGADLNADGRLLFFQSDRTDVNAGGFGGDDIYASNRATINAAWEAPVNLGSNVNSTGSDSAPEAASDLLTLYFHSTRPGGASSHTIWRATRATVNDIWGVPALVPAPVNSSSKDVEPGLSTNWKTLYFASDFGGETNIWIAEP